MTGLSTSKFKASEVRQPDGSWRVKIISSRHKFDDESKAVFLAEYSKHGRIMDSCHAAAISHTTFHRALKEDEDFAEACLNAEGEYRDALIGHHQNLVFNGTKKQTYDRNGNLVSEETVYPIPLIQMELRKHDKGYRDNKEIDVNVSGGVLIAPADINSIDDWEKKFAQEKVIEGEIVKENDEGEE